MTVCVVVVVIVVVVVMVVLVKVVLVGGASGSGDGDDGISRCVRVVVCTLCTSVWNPVFRIITIFARWSCICISVRSLQALATTCSPSLMSAPKTARDTPPRP